MSGLRYVYAVCRPFGTPLSAQLTGVAGVPPKQLTHHGLVAVVGHVPEEDFAERPLRAHLEDLDWLGATARAHQNVIDALTVVTSPLPLRLATVFLDDSGVRTMMEQREDAFLRTLDRLDGRVEWGVKVYAESPESPEASESTESREASESTESSEDPDSRPAPSPAKPVSGRDYLRQRRGQHRAHEEKWERAEEFSRRLHETLSGYAEETRIHAPQNAALSHAPGRNVLNAAYLVPRSESEAFVELVDRTKDDSPGLRVELTGPWAAYSFSGEDS
ncbi:GvpL/GvpF family gas vesicle protein [Streptomyces phaeochromogenes]|uniref:GvpL/GvpF family gas vesicle protein n=1 Tax=Streptomyces phaeochromogenes TaxID=1923 RepID=UPI00324F413F